VTFASTSPVGKDGRLRPELGKRAILGLAVAGSVTAIALILILSLAGTSSTKDQLVDVSGGVTPTTVTSAASGAPGTWAAYIDPDDYFSALLPSKPTVQVLTSANGPVHSWVSKSPDGKTNIVVVAAALPTGDWANNQQILKSHLDSMATSSGMAVKGEYTGTEGKTLHLDALLEGAKGSSNVRFFVANNTMYALSVVGTDAAANAQAFDKLTKSFAVH
jgi:hypothetical protein